MGQCACSSEHRNKDKFGGHGCVFSDDSMLLQAIQRLEETWTKLHEDKERQHKANNKESDASMKHLSQDHEKPSDLLPGNQNKNDSIKCIGSISLARQKFVAVNGGPPQMLPVNKETAMMLKDLDIKALEEECQELKTRLGAIKEGMEGQRSSDVEELLRQSQKELLWLQRQLSFISERSSLYMFSQDKIVEIDPRVLAGRLQDLRLTRTILCPGTDTHSKCIRRHCLPLLPACNMTQ
ncbi:hypothetical protein HHUSO_G14991 [Huso huso]|uniref:Uncharacterized protein n=1 Tax=Huso huso TaxID=61971 RepID=A0ABR0ZF95_HUSHU